MRPRHSHPGPRMDSAIAALYRLVGSFGQLRDLLRIVAEYTHADATHLCLDLGNGYLHEGFLSPRLDPERYRAHITGFREWSRHLPRHHPPHLSAATLDASNAIVISVHGGAGMTCAGGTAPISFIPHDTRLDSRHLAVGNGGRRAVPRSILTLMRAPERNAFGSKEHASLAYLLPHLCQVLQLTHNHEATRHVNSVLMETAGRYGRGIMLVDAQGRILHTNARAEGLAHDAQLLDNGRFWPSRYEDRQRLNHALRRSCETPGHATTITLRTAPHPLVIQVSPLPAHTDPMVSLLSPVRAILTLRLAQPVRASLADDIARHLRLTPAEFRLCQALVAGQRLKECAQQWHLAYDTLRTQLRSIFAKTGTTRQTELIALLDAFREG